VIQTDGRPIKLTYVQSTDQVWVEQTRDTDHHHQLQQQQQQETDDDDDDEATDVVVIRQASEYLLHHVVHIDQHSDNHDNRPISVRDVCQLGIWLRGHSRSLKLVLFISFCAVSYSPYTVTVAVSVAVCEIFSVKEWCDLENRVRVRSRSLKMASLF